MAWLQQYPSGHYHISFRLGGRKFKRSLDTKSESDAQGMAGRIEDNIKLVERGILSIPPGADIPRFLLSDGKIVGPVEAPAVVSLGTLLDQYEKAISGGVVEDSTLATIRIHAKHLKRILGEKTDVRTISRDRLQEYINARRAQRSNRGTAISPITIRKELTTLSGVWSWAIPGGVIGPFPNKGLKYPKGVDKSPFQTWEEIEKQIERGNLSEKDRESLWNCLFLSIAETTELLKHVKAKAQQPFLYPMVVLAAHTGARRSELIRSRLVDFDEESVIIRERKRSKKKHTIRRVPFTPFLKKVIQEWLQEHPGGPYTFCMKKVAHSKKHRSGPEPITVDEAQDHLKRALAHSKWEKLRGWHVMRHSFISNCALMGIDQRIIDSFVGHTTEEMRKRYTHLFPSAKKAAIEAVFGAEAPPT
ncbi:MAG: site-specific integrase [Pirellulales bacterium]|nr:site-specific integrase [Pirellulales bacterium]